MIINNVLKLTFLKRKLHTFYLLFLTAILSVILGSFVLIEGSSGGIYYVSPDCRDSNPATKEQPLKSFEAATDAARSDGASIHRIVIMQGEYFLSKPFELDSRDNGLLIEAEKNGTVVINGGTLITGWHHDGDKFWCADLP